MSSKLVFLTPDEHGIDLRGPGYQSISRVDKYARMSATQWSVDIFSVALTEDENRDDRPIVMGVHYKHFRKVHNAAPFGSAQEVVDYINERSADEVQLDLTQGHYGLLSNYYFAGGVATDTVIAAADVDQWVDVNFTIDPEGLYDRRTTAMLDAQPAGHTGAGTGADPILFELEGLTTQSSVIVNASLSFNPDVDESQLECRLNFFRNSSSSLPNFFVSDIAANMDQGAQEDYVAEPLLTFFCGDTISTVAPGDAGTFCFQVRSSSEGTLSLRALTLYISQ